MSKDTQQETPHLRTSFASGIRPKFGSIGGRIRRLTTSLRPRGPLLIVVAAVLVVVVILAVLPSRRREVPPPTETIVKVQVQVIEPIDSLADTFRVNGVVEASRVVEVAAEIDGRIESYAGRDDRTPPVGGALPAAGQTRGPTIAEGQSIEAGRPILYLNAELIRAEYDGAKAQYAYDTKEFQRVLEARDKGVATSMEYDEAEKKLSVSRAAYESAAARLKRAAIVAPISGIIDELPFDPGEYVRAGQTVAKIVDVDTVKVVVHTSETNVHYLRIGQQAAIHFDLLQEAEISGKITYISELADELTRTSRTEITVGNRPDATGRRRLRSGQIVKVDLTRSTLTDVIMIPISAVIPTEDGYLTYVVNDGEARQRPVRLGFMQGNAIQVLSGLGAGDRLIVAGQQYVGPGQKVSEVERR